jgi:hypothetical protein
MKRFQYFKSNAKATIASALVVFLSVSAVYVYGQCTETIQYGSNCFNPPLSTSCPSSPPSCGTCWECTGGPTSESQCAKNTITRMPHPKTAGQNNQLLVKVTGIRALAAGTGHLFSFACRTLLYRRHIRLWEFRSNSVATI